MMSANLAVAVAEDAWKPDVTVGPTLSSLGIGADVGVRFNDYVGLRVGGNYLSFDVDVNTTDMNYKAGFTLASIGGTTFPAAGAGQVTGEIDFNKFAPYLAVGLEGRFFEDRFILGTEAGILFQGRPQVDLRGDGPLAGDPTFEAALQQEEAALRDDLSFFRYYPVVAIYAMYRF